jgi:hypothetical protein
MPVLFLRSFSCLKAALLISALSLPVAPALAQEGNSGPYLAAIVAGAESDYAAAAAWYARAMLRDPTNPTLLTGAVVANLSIGEIGLAAESRRLAYITRRWPLPRRAISKVPTTSCQAAPTARFP